jgi:hypothetical protein
MLKTETVVIAEWYDFERVASLSFFCGRCGALIPSDAFEACADGTCPECGEPAKFSELDAYADSLISPVPHVDE